jgi:hypothetical protein
MKIANIFNILMILSFTHCQNTQNTQRNNINQIKIKSVDFTILSIISVECDNFERYFQECNTFLTTDTVVINEFLNQLTNMDPIDSSYSTSIDTRAKINLFSDADTNIICVGNLTLYMNGNIYKTPQKLIEKIEGTTILLKNGETEE